MNILFYIEPLIELDKPYFKVEWANIFVSDIINALKESSTKYDCRILTNEAIAAKIKVQSDITVYQLTQIQLLKPFGTSYMSATTAWHQKTYTHKEETYYHSLISETLEGYIPDIIISFSPVPFLRSLFQNALILHHEYSIFSRLPYPKTWFLDPIGMQSDSFIDKYYTEINNQPLTDTQLNLLENFKQLSQNVITSKSPFKKVLAKEHTKYEYLVLLPLQFSGYYMFDDLVPFKSQYEYCVYVLDHTPQSVGVVVNTHPEYPVLSEDAVKFLQTKYPHFIYREEFNSIYASGQYILPFVDAVVSVSSSLILQALLFDKKIITLGEHCFQHVSDGNSLDNISNIIKSPKQDREVLLFFILTRYAIGSKYLHDPRWISHFLDRSLEKFRNKGIDATFFDPIDKEESIIDYLSNVLHENIKLIPQYRYSHFIQLFVDTGNKFHEAESIRVPVQESPAKQEFVFDLSSYTNIKALRLDPLNDKCVIKVEKIQLVKDNGTIDLSISITSNAILFYEDQYFFNTNDAQIFFKNIDSTQLDGAVRLIAHVHFLQKGQADFDEHIKPLIKLGSEHTSIMEQLDNSIKKEKELEDGIVSIKQKLEADVVSIRQKLDNSLKKEKEFKADVVSIRQKLDNSLKKEKELEDGIVLIKQKLEADVVSIRQKLDSNLKKEKELEHSIVLIKQKLDSNLKKEKELENNIKKEHLNQIVKSTKFDYLKLLFAHWEELNIIKKHILFDKQWYENENTDVNSAGVSPYLHYITSGSIEGRMPHPLFDTRFYLDINPDVREDSINPLVHFITAGAADGRMPHPLFDTRFYLDTNPDVREDGINPLVHFITAGAAEGRMPHPLFDTRFYLDTNPDVREDGINPLVHFITSGAAEGRMPHPLFDTRFYLDTNPDVREDSINPLVHFITSGAADGRMPHPLFATRFYLDTNPDVREDSINPLVHFITSGAAEGRMPHPLFDTRFYLDTNPDVREDSINPLVHFITSGAAEGRMPHPLFDTRFYLDTNQDVRANGINPLLHFITAGAAEGRMPNPFFDTRFYLDTNQDVRANGINPLLHFVTAGEAEGRMPNPLFNTRFFQAKYPEIQQNGLNALTYFIQSNNTLDYRLFMEVFRNAKNANLKIRNCSENLKSTTTNILLTAHTAGVNLFGGERSFIDMLKALSSLDYNVTIVIPSGSSKPYLENICQYATQVISFNYGWWTHEKPLPNQSIAHILECIIKQYTIDLVYVNTIMLREPLIAAKKTGIPSIIHIRELIMHDKVLYTLIGEEPTDIIKKVTNSTDVIFANSHATAHSFQKNDATYLIPNTIDSQSFDIPNSIDNSVITIGLISSNIPKKGIYDFVEIAKLLESRAPTVQFCLIGPENNEISKLKRQQEKGDIPLNIVFEGYINNPVDAIGKVHIVLNLSHFQESFGRTVLEAMAARRPVIVYDWGALPELVEDGVNGYIVPFKDYKAVAEKIEYLSAHPQEIIKLGEAGRRIAIQSFDEKIYCKKMGTAIEDVLFKQKYALPNKQSQPRISVVVPNYNYEKYIEERLLSILNQTLQPEEIIFLDDMSTDSSVLVAKEILESQKKIPYKIIENSENQGVYKQWIRAFSEANGDYLWIAEADDTCDINFLEALSWKLKDDSTVIAYSQSSKIDGDGKLISRNSLAHTDDVDTEKWLNDYIELGLREVVDSLVYRNTIPNVSACVIKKSAFAGLEKGLLKFRYCGDWFLYTALLQKGNIAYVATPLNYFRRHQGSVTRTKGKEVDYLKELVAIKEYIFQNFPIHNNQLTKIKHLLDKDFTIDGIPKNSKSTLVTDLMEKVDAPIKKRRRIAFITTNNGSYDGGSEVLWRETALSMRNDGHDVIILIKRWEPAPEFFKTFEENGIKIYFKGKNEFAPIASFNPDLVVISTGDQDEGIEYFLQCRQNHLPYIIVNQLTKEEEYWPIRHEKIADVTEGYLSAKKAFFTCHNNHDIMEKRLGVTIPNYDIHFNPYHINREIKLPFPSMEKGLQIAIPGRLLMIHKGQDILIEVMKQEKWKKRDVTINLYGAGPDKEEIQKLIDVYHIENIRFMGKVNDVADIWKHNHAILMASRMEGMPIVLVGAMICARVAILTDIGGHSEVVDDNINGFIAKRPTPEDLDDAMERAFQRKDEFEHLGQLSREKILNYLPEDPIKDFTTKLTDLMDI